MIDRYENGLKGVDRAARSRARRRRPWCRSLAASVGEVQAAIRKEFAGNASFQSVFKAGEPQPKDPREMLALGRLVAREMPDYAQNLIKHAVNAASVKHVTSLADQLEHELGGAYSSLGSQSAGAADPRSGPSGVRGQARAVRLRALTASAGRSEIVASGIKRRSCL